MCPYSTPPVVSHSLIDRATKAPPGTASEPPSQKSFWTSTTMSARTRSRYRAESAGGGAAPAGGEGTMADYWTHNVYYQPLILGGGPAGLRQRARRRLRGRPA